MNTIYLITGPAGVGKSTISLKIAQSLDKSVLIEGDTIYHLVEGGYVAPWKEGNYLDFYFKNILSLIKNALEDGFDVVHNYILDKKQIASIKKNFPHAKIKFVCLMVDEETIIQRDKLRDPDCQMGERSLILLQEMKKANFDQNNILDTSHLSVYETWQEILANDRFII